MRTGAEGFTDTGDQDHYDECEAAVMRALQEVRRFSQDIKVRIFWSLTWKVEILDGRFSP